MLEQYEKEHLVDIVASFREHEYDSLVVVKIPISDLNINESEIDILGSIVIYNLNSEDKLKLTDRAKNRVIKYLVNAVHKQIGTINISDLEFKKVISVDFTQRNMIVTLGYDEGVPWI